RSAAEKDAQHVDEARFTIADVIQRDLAAVRIRAKDSKIASPDESKMRTRVVFSVEHRALRERDGGREPDDFSALFRAQIAIELEQLEDGGLCHARPLGARPRNDGTVLRGREVPTNDGTARRALPESAPAA